MKQILLLAYACICLSQTTDLIVVNDEDFNNLSKSTKLQLEYYSEIHSVEFDYKKYTLEEKDKIIYEAYFNNEYEKIESLVFFDKDRDLKYLNLWIDALFRMQAYFLLDLFFSDVLPQNENVLIAMYKMEKFHPFLTEAAKVKNASRILKYYIIKAKFYERQFKDVATIQTPKIRNEMSKTIALLKFRSLFYLKRFNEAIEYGKSFESTVLEGSPNDYLRLAVCYLSVNNLDIAELLFRKYEKFYRENELLNLQKSLFYQGFIYDERDDFENASVLYDKVLQLSTTSQLARGVHKNYAIHYQEKKIYSKAIEHWETYFKLLPETDIGRKEETVKIIAGLKEKLFLHPNSFQ